MSKRAVIALDVGRTTVDAACISADGEEIGRLRESSSPSTGTKDEIVNELAHVTGAARGRAGGAEVTARGFR
jgi:predicted NBD/HSP70 family sugar kinase